MKAEKMKFKTIDEYIFTFPVETQIILEELRNIIKQTAPNSIEKISYNMPAFFQNGILVYFAGYNNHIGFYPTASGIAIFTDEFKKYKSSKGTVQFPIGKSLPKSLITKIVKFRVKENLKKSK